MADPRDASTPPGEPLELAPALPAHRPPAAPMPPALRASLRAAPVPPWPVADDLPRFRWLAVALLLTLIGLYACVLGRFWSGAHPGVDQAGYLMTARQIVEHGRLYFVPENPYQFVSHMCIMTEPYEPPSMDTPARYRIYAKYPFGFPLLAAAGRWLDGVDGMYWVNPLCTVLACFFAYFLFRTALRRFTALIGVLLLMVNPLTLTYAHDSNSHASVLFCVCFGFWGLLSWWQTGRWGRGFLGAFALGYACTIRYSEFLLVLPVTFAALTNLRWNWRQMLSCAGVLAGWALPVAALALICWLSFGAPWKTGYTYCHEDTGFGWKYFIGDNAEPTNSLRQGNWATLLQQLNHTGLFLIWPLALAGLLGMLGRSWRLGITLLLWVIPSTALYLFYYWAPQGENTMGYLRFFLSVVPGFLFAALWLLEHALTARAGDKWPNLIAISLLAFVIAAWFVYYYTPGPGEPSARWRWAVGAIPLLLAAAIWCWERPHAAQRVPLALTLGALAALTCGVNLLNVLPDVENRFAGQLALRQTVDNLRAYVPTGSVVFADENLCNELDSFGGYQLYSHALLNPMGLTRFRNVYERLKDNTDDDPNPNPIQWERARFYLQLIGRQTPNGTWVNKDVRERNAAMNTLLQRAFNRQQRVVFLFRTDGQGGGRFGSAAPNQILPTRAGLLIKRLARWENTPPIPTNATPFFTANRPGAGNFRRGPSGGSWSLYEVSLAPPASRPAALSAALEARAAATSPTSSTRPATRP